MLNIDRLKSLFEESNRHNRIILEYSLLSDSLFNFGDYNEILDCIDKKSLKKIMKKHKFI